MNEIDEHKWVINPETIHAHSGHEIEIVTYSTRLFAVGNLAIECIECGVVLADIDYSE